MKFANIRRAIARADQTRAVLRDPRRELRLERTGRVAYEIVASSLGVPRLGKERQMDVECVDHKAPNQGSTGTTQEFDFRLPCR
jgi:hypothetical protein